MVLLLSLVAGCAALDPPTTQSPTLTPVPAPTATPTVMPLPDTGPAGGSSSTSTGNRSPAPGGVPEPYSRLGTYPIGPVAPTCPADAGQGARRYPPVVTRNATVGGSWSTGREAAMLADRAVSGADLEPGGGLVPVDGRYERVRVTGETFDPRRRWGTERFVVVTAPGNPALDAIVLAPVDGRTRIELYYVEGFC